VTEVHQLLHVASPGDAVTNAALEYRALLRRAGPSEIFAAHLDVKLLGDVLPLSQYVERPSAQTGKNVLLYHLSTGSEEVVGFLLRRPETAGIVYHNITPSRYFAPYSAELVAELDEGRRHLEALKDRVELALAVSPYNGRELEALGYTNVGVVPLIADLDDLPHAGLDHAAEQRLDEVDGPVLLFVGQLLPHKRPDLLLAAFHILSTYLVPEAVLLMVGAGRHLRYRTAVERYAHELNLTGARFKGWVSDQELLACYRRADVFVTASEHEGFCVPLLEAMHLGLPVVARSFAAIPETLDGAGLLLPADDDPMLLAEALHVAVTDQSVRDTLIQQGHRRARQIDPEQARAEFLAKLLELI
jgi:L-malate glycosyltransferase